MTVGVGGDGGPMDDDSTLGAPAAFDSSIHLSIWHWALDNTQVSPLGIRIDQGITGGI